MSLLKETGLAYVQVHEHIKKRIAKLNHGDRLPSEESLAHEFNIARGTVGRAMQRLEQEGYIFRQRGRGTFVKKIIAEVNAESTELATIAMVLPEIDLSYKTLMFDAICNEAKRRKCKLRMYNYDGGNRGEKDVLLSLAKEKLTGILVYPFFYEDPKIEEYAAAVKKLGENGIHVVLLDNFFPALECWAVMTDHMRMGYWATEHLLSLGHTRICYVSTGRYDVAGQAAVHGYKNALLERGVPYSERLLINIPLRFSAEPAHQAVKRLLHEDPGAITAIATSHFSMTHGIMKALADLKVRVPEDIAVVGCDAFMNQSLSHITHMREPLEEIGKTSVSILIEGDESRMKHRWFVPPRLIIGDTCGYNKKT